MIMRKLKTKIIELIFGAVRTKVGNRIYIYRPLKRYEPTIHRMHKEYPETRGIFVVESFCNGKTTIVNAGFNSLEAAMTAVDYLNTAKPTEVSIGFKCRKTRSYYNVITFCVDGIKQYLRELEGFAGIYIVWK